MRHALAYRDFHARPTIAPPTVPAPEVTARWRTRLWQPAALTESEGLELLGDYGVPVVPHRTVSSVEEATDAAAALGYPVELKTAASGVWHKSDAGGVALNLSDAAAVHAAYTDLAERLGPEVLVAPMVFPEVELALGVVRDPQFGSMVLVAGGGIFIEVLGDRQLGLVPIDTPIAHRMIGKLDEGVVGDPLPHRTMSSLPALIDTPHLP